MLVSFNWEDSGTSPLPDHLGTAGELGSCYGLGYRRSTQKVYTSAFIKRHVGLGPLGIGGIYEIDMTNPGSPVIVELIDVESIGVDVGDIGSNSDRGLPILLEDPSNDPDAFPAFRNNVGMSFYGSIGLNYHLTRDIQLLIEPEFRYFKNPFSRSDYILDQRYFTMGALVGLRMKL